MIRRGDRGWGVAVAVAVIASGLLGCTFGGASPDHEEPPVAVAERGAFQVVVEETGVLRATSGDRLVPKTWGMVAEVVDEGATVQPGDVVVRFDTSEIESYLQQVDAEMAETRAQANKHLEELAFQEKSQALDIKSSEAALEFARRKLASSRQALDDADRQLASGLISHAARDRAEVAWRAAAFDAERAQVQHERKLEDIATERRSVELERQRASQVFANLEARRRDVLARMEQASLKASIAGRVFFTKRRWRGSPEERKVRVGDDIGPWAGAVAEVPDLSRLEVRSQVDETLVGRVVNGTPVQVEVGAVEGLALSGRVTRVDPLAIVRSRSEGSGFAGSEVTPEAVEQVVFSLTVELDGTDDRLQPGMTVGVRYVLDELPDVVSVPEDAVFGKGAEAFVFVKSRRGHERRRVTVGPASAGRVVIEQGVAGGESVYLADPRAAEDAA